MLPILSILGLAGILTLGALHNFSRSEDVVVTDADVMAQVQPPNFLKGNCPGSSLSLNFFHVLETTTKVSGTAITEENAAKLVKKASIPHEYKGKTYKFDLPKVDLFWAFPTNGETYPTLTDNAFVFGVKGPCVVYFNRMPLGLLNSLLDNGPKILPHVSPETKA